MEKTVRENLQNEFTKYGENFTQVEYCEETGRYLYKRSNNQTRITGWEVICPREYVNPDSSLVFVYPATSEFGKYAWFLPPNVERTKIYYYLKGFNKKMEYKEYLKTIK